MSLDASWLVYMPIYVQTLRGCDLGLCSCSCWSAATVIVQQDDCCLGTNWGRTSIQDLNVSQRESWDTQQRSSRLRASGDSMTCLRLSASSRAFFSSSWSLSLLREYPLHSAAARRRPHALVTCHARHQAHTIHRLQQLQYNGL